MADELEAALAWYASTETTDLVVGLRHGHTLAAAVRDLQRDHARVSALACNLAAQTERAEAALAEMRGRTCATCKHLRVFDPAWYCGQLSEGVCGGIRCQQVGFTCGAWAAKEQPTSNATTAVPITEANRGTQIV
jgi:hypothetical protein